MRIVVHAWTGAAWTADPPPALLPALERARAAIAAGEPGLVRLDLPPMAAPGELPTLLVATGQLRAALVPGLVAGAGLRLYHAVAQSLALDAGDRCWAWPIT